MQVGRRRAPFVITTAGVMRFLFAVMILVATYDKSGVMVQLGDHAFIVTPYKVIFITLVILFCLGSVGHRRRLDGIDRGVYRLLIALVVVQTLASLAALIVAPGPITLSSEGYYFIQRLNFLFIPVVGVRCRFSPRNVLNLFIAAILIHMFFIAVQFGTPQIYRSFVDYVFNPLWVDNTYVWDGKSISYIGLFRTGNYGAFAAAFGLLVLGLSPRTSFSRGLRTAVAGVSIWIAFTSGSRAVFIMTLVALGVFAIRTRMFSRKSIYIRLGLVTLALAGSLLFVTPRFESFRSAYAFVDPEREGSNMGKLMILDYGTQLFAQSPIVGWGSRRFSDISAPVGNDLYATSETHSYVLSTLLQTGLVGLAMYCVVFGAMARNLWQRREKDYAIVAGLFIGLGLYNIVYDAGGLDVFALFNGVAAYYALKARQSSFAPSSQRKATSC